MYFSKTHEWIKIDGNTATIGISDYAQSQLGDIVFVELPEIGQNLAAGDEVAVIESVKAASEIYTPCGGTIVDINAALNDDAALVNGDAQGAGWIFRLTIDAQMIDSILDTLMDAPAYQNHIKELA